MAPISVVILAAGQGSRMYSDLPKVLHLLAGKPLLTHVVETALAISEKTYIIYGHAGEQVRASMTYPVEWVHQATQQGTAHAVQQALPYLADHTRVLVLLGDVPLISAHTLKQLIDATPEQAIGWLTATVADPTGLGRIVRGANGQALGIVEEKDATPEQKKIREINTGICLIPVAYLREWLPQLKANNAQKEYYLTDLFALAREHQVSVVTISPTSLIEVQGVNTPVQLAELERAYQKQYAEKLMKQGVCLRDPHRFDVRGNLQAGRDVVIDVNVVFEGEVTLGDHTTIGAQVCIKNSRIGQHVTIESHCVIDGTVIEDHAHVGPFARLRPGTVLKPHAKVGNFVEVKNTVLGENSKASHLSYLGDAVIAAQVNIGAGTITCNYDGVNKHQTRIEEGAFIGSNTALVAPVTIGAHATIGAGSTIRQDAPAGELTLTRVAQTTVSGWKRPKKREKS